MKLSLLPLLCLATLSTSASPEPIDVEFRGILDLAGSRVFSLSTEGGTQTAWVAEGDVFAGYEISEFRADEKALVLRKDGEDYVISLGPGGVIRGDIDSASAVVDVSNLRQIAQAALIFANDNGGRLPGGETVETIHEVARLLARGGGLNDASFWVSKGDAESGSEDRLSAVLDGDRFSLDPLFAAQNIVAFDFATGLHTGLPSSTPVAWTRGLREDGSWDEQGVYGSAGGFIVFLGGNVLRYKDLTHEGARLVRPDGTRTSNILEALPPEARVVGSGPKSLHGATAPQGARTGD